MTQRHSAAADHTAPADEAPWTREHDVLEPAEALRRISQGSRWVVHWCCGPSVSSTDAEAAQHLASVRAYRHLIGPDEQRRLRAKAVRKRRGPTVVLVELWVSAAGTEVVAFVEGAPDLLPARESPFAPV